jgi:hypothetical protein
MAEIDWNVAPQELKQGPSREEELKRQQGLNAARIGLAKSLNPFVSLPLEVLPIDQPTSLPQAGGLLGGLASLAFPEARLLAPISRLTQAAPAVAKPFIPSLVGSTAGTSLGTLLEQGLTGKDIFSTETGMKLLANNIENAAFDVGGNLLFSFGGKAIKVIPEQLEKLGFKKGLFDTEEGAARKAAQEWLSSRDATLTRGQLTGNLGTQTTEGTLKFTSGGEAFAKQQASVKAALDQGINDVMSTLEKSDSFQTALKQGDPTQMAIGDRWQTAVAEADKAMKEKYRPVYQQMEQQGDGLLVDMTPLKKAAKDELDRLNKNKAMSSAADDKRKVLEQILAQEDKITFSTAHDLRSDFLASARDATKEGMPANTLEAYYKKYAQGLRNNMDDIAVITFGSQEQKDAARRLGLGGGIDQPAGLRTGQFKEYNIDSLEKLNLPTTQANRANNELLRNYFNAQNGYKNAMEGLYGGTMKAALKAEPSAVGELLFNVDRPERIRDVSKAIAEMQKYLPADQSKGLLGELQYGYLNKMFGSPEGVLNFSQKLQDKTFKEGFDYLFRDSNTKKQLLDIANAAKYGLEETPGSTVLRSKMIGAAAGAGATAVAGGGAFLAFPDEVQNNLIPTIGTLGALYLTPKLLSRALTSKSEMDMLAMLSKAQDNPKYAGAMGAKIANMLNKSGIIDSEYLNSVNQMIYGQQPQEKITVPAPIDWSVEPK